MKQRKMNKYWCSVAIPERGVVIVIAPDIQTAEKRVERWVAQKIEERLIKFIPLKEIE